VEEIGDDSPTTPESVALTEAQKLDLERRLDAYEADPFAGSSWEEVKARLQSRSGGG
jgi:putative addiction module component (TIGR02574 family)